jgi:hypothetical protein
MLAAFAIVAAAVPTFGQSFNSTSTGSDGALNLTTAGTIVFNPQSFNPPLDPAHDNIFNFTTINIAAGVTVQLTGQILNGPVYWLAQGPVTINGTIDLNGGDGYSCGSVPDPSIRIPSVPGPGGYAGGVGGIYTDTFNDPFQPGAGPGGGTGGNSGTAAGLGKFTGNPYLVPLIGGSGGTGGYDSYPPGVCGGGGGAGGGGILIASSTSISVNGSITSNGGNGGLATNGNSFPGGIGSGGAIRLVALFIQGNGTISAGPASAPGVVRLEAFQQNFTGTIPLGTTALATPASVITLPSGGPATISVTSVAGVPIPANPTGSFSVPDGAINQSTPAAVVIQANNIPLGTVATLYIISENGPDITVQTSALAGTLASSTATASVTFPPGYSRGYVKATWTQ